MFTRDSFRAFCARHSQIVFVELASVKGSTPREAGAFMLVAPRETWGTIGGGQLEYRAIAHALKLMVGEETTLSLDIPLGPEIGQCCGGRTLLRFLQADPHIIQLIERRLEDERAIWPDVYIFGAGHVGKALVRALSPLPLAVTMVETRAEELQGLKSEGVSVKHVAMPEALVADIRPGGAVLVMTHDHALDFLIAREALMNDDLLYVGMIGSSTKRATFVNWLAREGEDETLARRLILPIGGASVRDKRPAVIAAMVAAELLDHLL
jgi:xanthine dehydrogenase accessory factor